jgi:hypothetical protein
VLARQEISERSQIMRRTRLNVPGFERGAQELLHTLLLEERALPGQSVQQCSCRTHFLTRQLKKSVDPASPKARGGGHGAS